MCEELRKRHLFGLKVLHRAIKHSHFQPSARFKVKTGSHANNHGNAHGENKEDERSHPYFMHLAMLTQIRYPNNNAAEHEWD